jgi:ATP-dependent DNA ligase
MVQTEMRPPHFIRPQLALLAEVVPHELEFDGDRLHARLEAKQARLLTRTGLDWTDKYEAVAAALGKLPARSAYIDGELCAFGRTARPAFLTCKRRRIIRTPPDWFISPSICCSSMENLSALPLIERKARLKKLLRRAPNNIYFIDHVIGSGQAFYDAACKHVAEGIVSKRVDAPYKPGDCGIWRKVKCINEDEFVVVGFTNPEGRRPYLGALLLG